MKCAAQYSWPTETTSNLGQNQTITYDHISAGHFLREHQSQYNPIAADFDNADAADGADGNLDIDTGMFTAVTAGIYEVSGG